MNWPTSCTRLVRDDELWNDCIGQPAATETRQIRFETVASRLGQGMVRLPDKTHAAVDEKMKRLPANILLMVRTVSLSPLALERPNKDELFLHLSLLDNAADRRSGCRNGVSAPLPPRGLVEPRTAPLRKVGSYSRTP